jgi:hypothetical protein
MLEKICTKCNNPFPATSEYFYRYKKGKYGLLAKCKVCSEMQKDTKKIAEYRKEYNKKNEDWIKFTKKIWNKLHPNYAHDYYITNKERYIELNKKLKIKNADKNKQYHHEWEKANKDKCREYSRKSRLKKRLKQQQEQTEQINETT